jgi:hypothetical protein
MAADPLIYCLEQLTDYDQFERLCHDMMALDGYRNIEPLGGSKDKGRDAIHVDSSTGSVTLFAYSVREDWRTKLAEDSEKIRKHGHACDRLAFLCTATYSSTERDEALAFINKTYGWPLELYGLERIASLLRSTHQQLVAQHPQIFSPPFFPFAGGLSLVFSPDHLVIDHVDADGGLALWLARRLTLAGYRVWCRGLAPLAGSSANDTVRSLLNSRALRYVAVLSPEAIGDLEFTVRRNAALAVGAHRGSPILIPAIARPIDTNLLDQETRGLTPARFDASWASGLKDIESTLVSVNCPRMPEGGGALAIRSYFPDEIIRSEPEVLASNLFRVSKFPEVIHRFYAAIPMGDDNSPLIGQWAFRKVSDTHFLSFQHPPPQLAVDYGITTKGGSVWTAISEMDGIPVGDLLTELIKKAFYAECRRRGLQLCSDRGMVYFPADLLKNDILKLERLDGSQTHFSVVGERTHGWGHRASKYRYHIAPVFVPKGNPASGYEIIIRIRVHITDLAGNLYPGRAAHIRRKKLCKSWWNEEWLNRVMGVMQFLAENGQQIAIGASDDERITVDRLPRTYLSPIRLNEEALGDAKAIAEEEIVETSDYEDDDEEDGSEQQSGGGDGKSPVFG